MLKINDNNKKYNKVTSLGGIVHLDKQASYFQQIGIFGKSKMN